MSATKLVWGQFMGILAVVFLLFSVGPTVERGIAKTSDPCPFDALATYRISEAELIPLDFTQLPEAVRPADNLGADVAKHFPNPNRVILGIESPRHYYLIVGNRRYDGRVMRMPSVTTYKNAPPAGKGLMVEFTNLPPQAVKALREQLQAPPDSVTLTCPHGACSILSKAGVRFADRKGLPVRSAEALKRFLDHGLELADGSPLSARIYSSSNHSLEEWISILERQDDVMFRYKQRQLEGREPEDEVQAVEHEYGPVSEEVRNLFILTFSPDQKPSGQLVTAE